MIVLLLANDDDLYLFRALSCMAKKHKVILTGHTEDKQPCTNGQNTSACEQHSFLLYNTQVVFDESGNFVTKYHKTHLYDEPQNTPGTGELVSFTSSFGVTFGLIACFDIMWSNPTDALIEQGVTNFIEIMNFTH
eukprot:Nk52_evm5s296 gene=Nk52_evmTU5s296